MSKFLLSRLAIQGVRHLAIPTITPEQNDWDLSEQKYVGSLGNMVFTNLVFDARKYTFNDETIDFKGLRIDTVIMTVNQTKNIVKTPVQGRDGTVKEYISDGDFSISVSGTLVGDGGFEFPKEKMVELLKVLNIPQSIAITSEYLNFFGVSSVVVDSYSFPQKQGSRNAQDFSISLTSDDPLEIQINNDEQIQIEASTIADNDDNSDTLI